MSTKPAFDRISSHVSPPSFSGASSFFLPLPLPFSPLPSFPLPLPLSVRGILAGRSSEPNARSRPPGGISSRGKSPANPPSAPAGGMLESGTKIVPMKGRLPAEPASKAASTSEAVSAPTKPSSATGAGAELTTPEAPPPPLAAAVPTSGIGPKSSIGGKPSAGFSAWAPSVRPMSWWPRSEVASSKISDRSWSTACRPVAFFTPSFLPFSLRSFQELRI
mmetsp:Transcript_104680/g.300969  ORF Transcript_104680/g.300969 Transcript_104680/m.300969 type:complete len:220 (-) Transcript_104680:217-876(-)